MSYLIISFTLVLILIGLVAAFFDLKNGIIPNKLIVFGYFCTIFLYLFFFFLNLLYLRSPVIFNYLFDAFINGLLCAFLGFAFWKFRFWSAGDGKLFGLYGFLLPLEFYSESFVSYFPGFALLVNLFIPLILVMLVKLIIYLFKNNLFLNKIKKKDLFNKRNILKVFKNIFFQVTRLLLFVITFSFLFQVVNYFELNINNIAIFIFILSFFYFYSKIRIKYKSLLFLELFIILIFFNNLIRQGNFAEIGRYFKIVLFFMIVIVLLKEILLFYVDKKEAVEIKVKNIQPGMILTKKWRNYFSNKISTLDKNNKAEYFKNLKSEGLTVKQVDILKSLFRDNSKYKVKICKTLNFAPFLFLAAIISIATSNSFLTLINIFLRSFLL